MDTLSAIRDRRAVKHFDPRHPCSQEEVDEFIELAMQSPTAFNLQHWRFVVVRDPALREQLRAAAWGQAQVTDASLLIIMTAKVTAWQTPEPCWRDAPREVAGMMVPMIGQYYQGREQVQRDECFRSMGIAAQTLMLAAKAKGYDSCPMDGFDFAKVAELIRLPNDHIIGMFVAIGKATKPAWPKPGQMGRAEVVIHDRF